MKDYFLKLLTTCAPDNGFAQDAIAYALLHHWVHATGEDFEADVRAIMLQYDAILEGYRPILTEGRRPKVEGRREDLALAAAA